ncbi:MAG: cupin domain-containing protein [Pseudomonadota bacterium]
MNFKVLPDSFDQEDFLRNYWQKKPLLIRASGKPFADPLEPEELAGFACEDFIESRLIQSYPGNGASQWKVSNGPFTELDFRRLPDTHWSLLIQAVDQWHEGVREMLDDFRFIPSWRIDDVMISYATDGGGVGPHFDYYDVFLIQGLGKKRWRLGGHVDSDSALLPDLPLRLLAEFNTEEDWIVEPGDILYLPPNLAHYGVAIGDSITYSIGFRTPSIAGIIDDLSSEVMQELREDQRYVDTDPRLPTRSGEIDTRVTRQLISLLQEQLLSPDKVTRWFGRYMTTPKYPDLVPVCEEQLDPDTLQQYRTGGLRLVKNPSSRFAFTEHADGSADLFVDGHAIACPATLTALLPDLCEAQGDSTQLQAVWDAFTAAGEDGAALLARLYNQGSLLGELEEEDDE